MGAVNVNMRVPATVADFLASDAFVRLIMGPVGSGKSSGCNVEILRRAVQQKPGPDGVRRTRFAIIRNTYRELKDTTRQTFEQWVPGDLGQWREQDFTFHMRFSDVECDVLFRALDTAHDVKKLLSLELTGAYINEAREVPRTILDTLKSRIGRYPSRAQGSPTWSGIWMDTNPMHTGHELYKLFKLDRPEGHALFEQPSGLSPKAENIENLPPGYYERICQGQDEEWVDEYVRAKYPNHDKGSVYGEQLALLDGIGATGKAFEHPEDGIFPAFDLGVSDATAIWWFRPNGAGGLDFLDYFEDTGKKLSFFIDELKRREEDYGWQYTRIILPHDARQRALTGVTVVEEMDEAYRGKVDVLPALSLEDGISSLRYVLGKVTRFHPRCAEGLKMLRAYRYEFDLDRRVYSRKPVHDFTSHGADAARYAAIYSKRGELLARPKPVEARRGIRTIHDFTLDEFYALQQAPRRSGRVD